MITQKQARSEMLTMFKTHWDAHAPAAMVAEGVTLFNPADVFYQGVETRDSAPQETPYAKVTINHSPAAPQSSLACYNGKRKWERNGVIIVQTFGPTADGKGLNIALALATVAREAFQGKASQGGVWFRNVSVVEVGAAGEGWFQYNTTANFTYEEVA